MIHPGPLSTPVSPSWTTEDVMIVVAAVIDKYILVISVSISKNIVDNVLLDGGSGVNVITKDERWRLGLSKPSPAPFNLKMANGTLAQPKGLIRDVKIHIHGIPYIVTLIVIGCSTVKLNYRMLLGRPWLRHANWGNNEVQIMGNGTIKTIKINHQLGYEAVTPHALICYNFVEGIMDEEEEILMAADPTLHIVGTIDWNFASHRVGTQPD